MALRNVFENVSTESKQQEILDRLNEGTPVSDDLFFAEYLEDQQSTGDTLTFTFSQPVNQIWVEFSGLDVADTARFTVGAENTPTASRGTPLSNLTPYPVTLVTDTVKVLAPNGSTVTVYGYRR